MSRRASSAEMGVMPGGRGRAGSCMGRHPTEPRRSRQPDLTSRVDDPRARLHRENLRPAGDRDGAHCAPARPSRTLPCIDPTPDRRAAPAPLEPDHLVAPGRLAELLEDVSKLPPGATEPAWAAALTPGAFVGGYEIVRVAGRGGLADVHEARERSTGRVVALKLFRPGPRLRALVSEDALRAEADAAARIEHPNVLGYHDAGTWAGGPFVVSEWLDGMTLQERLRERPLPEGEVLRFSRAIAAALEAAHAAGVAHRDLEPGNVLLLPDGRVKVTGFGLARPSGKNLSAGGAPPFLAPEQWRGEPGDARSDVFALGVIMFQAFTGNIPYAVAGSHTEALERGRTPHPGGGVPWRIAEVVTRCLHRDPRKRYRDGAELAQALAAAEHGGPLPRKARRAVAAVAALAAVAAAAAGVAWYRGQTGGTTVPVVVLDEADLTTTGAFAGVSDLLSRALAPSDRVRAIPRADLAGAVRAGGSGRLDVKAVAPAWEELKARWALELTVRRLSSGYVGELSAVAPRTGDRAFTVAERFTDLSDAVEMVDRLARRARLELGETAAEVDARPARLSRTLTPDLEAWRWYQAGEQCLDAPRAPERPCAEPFRQAAAKDPGFGAAQLALALLALEGGADLEAQRAALEPVTAAGARLPPRAAELAAAWRSALSGDDRAALGAYGKLADADLADRDAPLLAADLAWQRGNLEDAATWLERAQRAAPDDPAVLSRLARVLGHLGDRGRLEGLAGKVNAGTRSSASLHVLSLVRGWLGDGRAAAAAAEIARRAGSPLAADDAVRALASSGDLDGAERVAREDLAAAPPARRPSRRILLAETLVEQGRWKEAQKELDQALAEAGPADVAVRVRRVELLAGRRDEALLRRELAELEPLAPARAASAAALLAFAGDLAGAAPLALKLPAGSPAASLHAAVASWRGGDAAAGASALRDLAKARRHDTGLPAEAVPYFLGGALADAGEHQAAMEALRKAQALYETGGVRPWANPRSRLQLATALIGAGRRVEATEELGKLLGSLQRADPDDGVLRAARILQVQLEGR